MIDYADARIRMVRHAEGAGKYLGNWYPPSTPMEALSVALCGTDSAMVAITVWQSLVVVRSEPDGCSIVDYEQALRWSTERLVESTDCVIGVSFSDGTRGCVAALATRADGEAIVYIADAESFDYVQSRDGEVNPTVSPRLPVTERYLTERYCRLDWSDWSRGGSNCSEISDYVLRLILGGEEFAAWRVIRAAVDEVALEEMEGVAVGMLWSLVMQATPRLREEMGAAGRSSPKMEWALTMARFYES